MAETFKDYIGQPLGVSEWFNIDQQRINQFADTTIDHQYIHVDKTAAAKTPFGGTIAHGMLTLSLSISMLNPFLERFTEGKTVLNYGFNKVRFISPTKCDADIRLIPEVVSVEERSDQQLMVTLKATMEIKGENKPAFIAELLLLIV